VLTADHCGQTASCVFLFRYQRSGCGSGSAPTNMSVSGCTMLTTNGNVDCRLLRITSTIPNSYEPYYSSWTRTTSSSPTGFAMGHPDGGPKMISLCGTTIAETNMWRVTWTAGMLLGGSSGGPLFDNQGRVRGPACCVNHFNCPTAQTAWFGRFDRFWTLNNIAQWLDPIGANPTSWPGHDPIPPPCNSGAANYCVAALNSTGFPALISSVGSLSIAANNFQLYCSGVPPNKNGIFYYGPQETQVPFGHGFRCVGGTTFRLPVVQADAFGDMFYDLDFTQPPANSGPGQIVGGATWRFQCWYRDPQAGPPGYNLSDGLRVTFCT
jgi:hypothetical protein